MAIFLRAAWLCVLSMNNVKEQLLTLIFQIEHGSLPIDCMNYGRGNNTQKYEKLLG